MTYTEIQKKGSKTYYYRVRSIRKARKVTKVRQYLGKNLSKDKLRKLELEADKKLNSSLNSLLTKKERLILDQIKKNYFKLPKESYQNRYETFLVQFTYNTNAIEGNTLSLQETSYVLFENRTPEGKSLKEINEVLNHKKAFDFILQYKKDIDKKLICELQRIIVSNTLKEDLNPQIGRYREIQVYIREADFTPPKPNEVRKEMKNLLFWYSRNKKILHPLIQASYFHAAFEYIHPFVDGNGRTGRLLSNFILHKNNFPMVNIPNSKKLEYYKCLEEARKGNLIRFIKFLFDIMMSTEVHI